MQSSHLINIGFALFLMTMFFFAPNEAQARGTNRNSNRAMQQFRQQQMKLMQAQQLAVARQTAAIAAE